MNQLDNVPRQKLRELIVSYGRTVGDDSRRCRSLLMDVCGSYRREVNLLVSVAEEPGMLSLLEASSVPPAMQIAQVTKRLHENQGLAEEFARWAVVSWALALGLITEDVAQGLDTQATAPMPSALPPPAPTPISSYPPPMTPYPPLAQAPMSPYQHPMQQPPSAPMSFGARSMHGPPVGATIVTFREHQGSYVLALAWSPDGRHLASDGTGDKAIVWESLLGRVICTYKHKGFLTTASSIAWSPDSAYVVSGSSDKKVHVWNATDASPILIYTGHQKGINAVSWSPDGKRIASAEEQVVQVWNYKSGELLTQFEHKKSFLLKVESVAWSPHARSIASAGCGDGVRVWNASNGNPIYTYKEQGGTPGPLAWSPDGMRITSGSSDGTVHVWEAETGSYRVICRGHTKTIRGVAFSPDGRRVASVSDDGTARIWDSQTGQQLFVYEGHIPPMPQPAPGQRAPTVKIPNLRALAWSPDGRHIASGGNDGLIHVWFCG